MMMDKYERYNKVYTFGVNSGMMAPQFMVKKRNPVYPVEYSFKEKLGAAIFAYFTIMAIMGIASYLMWARIWWSYSGGCLG